MEVQSITPLYISHPFFLPHFTIVHWNNHRNDYQVSSEGNTPKLEVSITISSENAYSVR